MIRAIKMNEHDSCATVLEDVKENDLVAVYNLENNLLFTLKAACNIAYGNKICLNDIKKDEFIYKYGEKIAIATQDIKQNYLIHVHNTKSLSVDIPPAMKAEIIRQMEIKL